MNDKFQSLIGPAQVKTCSFVHEFVAARSLLTRFATFEMRRQEASFYLKECEDMNKSILRILIASAIGLSAIGASSAQTTTQNINVTVHPATTVEERVANDMKEKALRKEAEEKLAAEESAKIAEANPRTLLSRARTLFIDSDTSFFESVQLQNALRSRTETVAWQLAIVDAWDKRNVADVLVSIDRPLFTYTFTYKVTHRATGIILASGKVTAFDGNDAAPKLAEKIVEEIRNARGEAKPKK
jgi:hypothetical protein